MITDFYPGFDEAAASKEETKWARRYPDRDANTCEVCNTKMTPHDLTKADAETLDWIDEEFINGLRNCKG